MTSILTTKMFLALSLCLLLSAGAWVPLVTTDRENTTTDTHPAWEVRTHSTRSDPILIYNVDDLQNMRNDLTADYALANDIDASETRGWNLGAGFMPVGSYPSAGLHFTGSLDGCGYNITELYINLPDTDYAGLFGCMGSGGRLSNVDLIDVDITGYRWVGGLVGWNDGGSVSNCNATGNLNGNLRIGGLVGRNAGGSVDNCYATVNVSGSDWYVGGLVGVNTGSVKNSHATGSVSGEGNNVGGLVGWNYGGSVSDCYATGSVSGTGNWVGGLVGSNAGSVSDCYATGNVSGNELVGGLVGRNYLDGSVSNCYATGIVRGSSSVGGLVGSNYEGSVENSYAMGSVTRSSGTCEFFGGFVGQNFQGKIINCYSTGSVHYEGETDPTGKGFCGGVDTNGEYKMTGNFWDTEPSGQASTAGNATGTSTVEMKSLITFTGASWDIVSVSDRDSPNTDHLWNIVDGATYPFLSWEGTIQARAPSAPRNLSAIAGDSSVRLDWDVPTDDGSSSVTLYSIYRKEDGGSYARIDQVDGSTTGYRDTSVINLNIYYYYVTANNSEGESDPSNEVHAKPTSEVVEPSAPRNLRATAGDEHVLLDWDVPADDGGSAITSYAVYRKGGGGSYSRIAQVDDSTTGYQDTSVTNDKTYSYYVTANNSEGESDPSNEAHANPTSDSTPPTADAGPDQTVGESTEVTFDGSASTSETGIVSFTWTFHDGIRERTLYDVTPTHTFTVPGTHTVTLTVSDDVGLTDTDTMNVTVLALEVIFHAISVSPEQPRDGDTVTITITLKNTGEGTARNVDVTVKIDGAVIITFSPGDLPAGETATRDHAWTVQKGTYTLQVELTYTGGTESHTHIFEVRNKSSDSPGFEVVGAVTAVGLAVVLFGKKRD